MHTQQILLEVEFFSPTGIINTMSFKDWSVIPRVKAEKNKIPLAGEKEIFVYKVDTFLFKMIEQLG